MSARANLYQVVKNVIEHVTSTAAKELVENCQNGNCNINESELQKAITVINNASSKATIDAFREIESWAAKNLD